MAKTAIDFYTRSNLPVGDGCPTGTKYDTTYEMKIDAHGHKVLKAVGQTDRYAKIQSHAEECDIEVILKKATLDPTVLNRRIVQYGDFTDSPKTLAEAQQMMIDLENAFKDLPLEVREKFDFSVEKFIHDAGSKSWIDALSIKKEVAEKPVEEVKVEKGAEE